MIELVLAADDYAALNSDLMSADTEKWAVLYAGQTVRDDGVTRLLSREIQQPSLADYTRRGAYAAELSPEFVARVTKRAFRESTALVFVHSHPGSESPHF